MDSKGNRFTRAQCDNCGASLSRTKQKGKYVCQYCGTVYYDHSQTEDVWEEGNGDIGIETEMPGVVLPVSSSSSTKSNTPIWILLGLVTVLIACGVMIFASGLGNTSSTSKQAKLTDIIDEPSMLTVLPAAQQAGTAVAYDNWEIVVSPEVDVKQERLSFEFTLQNWHDGKQMLRYMPKSFVVYDDIGNTYPIYLGNCTPDIPYIDRQITFESHEIIRFQSDSNWCNSSEDIPFFTGVVPLDAKHLYFRLEKVGVFENITFVFDL